MCGDHMLGVAGKIEGLHANDLISLGTDTAGPLQYDIKPAESEVAVPLERIDRRLTS